MSRKGHLTRHTQETVDDILVRWRNGESQIAIGKLLDITTGAVAGIVTRSKLKGETAARPFRPGGRSLRPLTDQAIEVPPLLHTAITKTPSVRPSRRESLCQWIAGEPSPDDRCKCGALTGDTRLYCPEHELVARPIRRLLEEVVP